MNSAIGPYKGGLRFHPSVNLSILKFLAFEQVFKNSLTTLPLGGGKGGSDFDPKGQERRRGHALLPELHERALSTHRRQHDVPAGDIGVGGREIGFLFGQYKRLANEFTGVLDRQGCQLGRLTGSPRGHGVRHRLLRRRTCWRRATTRSQGKTCLVSGSGNVAQYATEKLIELGAKRRHPVRLQRLRLRRSGHRPREARLRHGAEESCVAAGSTSTPRSSPSAVFTAADDFARFTTRSVVPSRRTARSRARPRTRSMRQRRQAPPRQRRATSSPRGPTCRRPPRASSCSWTRRSCSAPARRPTPAVSRSPGSRWRRTACATAWTRDEVDNRLQGHHVGRPPPPASTDRRPVRRTRQLRHGREHLGVLEGRRLDDGPGHRLDARSDSGDLDSLAWRWRRAPA